MHGPETRCIMTILQTPFSGHVMEGAVVQWHEITTGLDHACVRRTE